MRQLAGRFRLENGPIVRTVRPGRDSGYSNGYSTMSSNASIRSSSSSRGPDRFGG